MTILVRVLGTIRFGLGVAPELFDGVAVGSQAYVGARKSEAKARSNARM